MLSYKELARLRKVRRYLNVYARGAGAEAARSELDEWIALCNMGFARITHVTWDRYNIPYYRITALGRRVFPSVDVPVEEGAIE